MANVTENVEKISRRFTHIVIPREIWLRRDISIQAKNLWAEMFSLHDEEKGGCYASDEYLMEFMQLKRSRLHEIYAELKKVGLLNVISFDGRKTIRRAIYPETQYTTGRQLSGKPDTSNAPDGSYPENRIPDVRFSEQQGHPCQYILEKKEENNICPTPLNLTHTATPIREKVPQIFFSYSNQKFEGITENDIKSWKELYNAIDIQLSLKEMEQWALANPAKAKNKKLWRKFIINWLRQANDKSVNRTAYQQMKQKAPEDDKVQTVRVNKVWIDSIKNKFTNLKDSEIRIEDNCVTLVDRSRGLREPIGYAENNFKDIITNFLRKRGVS